MNKPGRNDPCHCGSGKKYKKCCAPHDEAARAGSGATGEEPTFFTELRPDLDQKVDRLLQQLEQGAGRRLENQIKQLWEEHPHYHMTNYAMGLFMAQVMKDAPGAIRFFEKAVEILPLFPQAHFNLGMACRQSAELPRAVAAFRAAVRYSRADGVADLARTELRWLETVMLRDSPFPTLEACLANARLFDQAFQHLADGRHEQAVELFKRVLAGNPSHVQSYGNLGLAYAGLGRRGEAMACFDRALELDPHYEPARTNRRTIAVMREGQPFVPDGFKETHFYLDKLRQTPGATDPEARPV